MDKNDRRRRLNLISRLLKEIQDPRAIHRVTVARTSPPHGASYSGELYARKIFCKHSFIERVSETPDAVRRLNNVRDTVNNFYQRWLDRTRNLMIEFMKPTESELSYERRAEENEGTQYSQYAVLPSPSEIRRHFQNGFNTLYNWVYIVGRSIYDYVTPVTSSVNVSPSPPRASAHQPLCRKPELVQMTKRKSHTHFTVTKPESVYDVQKIYNITQPKFQPQTKQYDISEEPSLSSVSAMNTDLNILVPTTILTILLVISIFQLYKYLKQYFNRY